MKQHTDTPEPKDAPSSAFASAEAMHSPPELQGNRRQGRKEGTDEEMMSRPPEQLQGNRRQEKSATPVSACAAAEETAPPPPEHQGTRRQERARFDMRAHDEEEEDKSSDEELRPGAVAVAGPRAAAMAGVVTGRTSPTTLSVHSEPQGPSAVDDQSTIMGELAGPSPEGEELRRRYQDLQQMVNETVTGRVL